MEGRTKVIALAVAGASLLNGISASALELSAPLPRGNQAYVQVLTKPATLNAYVVDKTFSNGLAIWAMPMAGDIAIGTAVQPHVGAAVITYRGQDGKLHPSVDYCLADLCNHIEPR